MFSASAGFHLLEERGLLAFTSYPVSPQAISGTVQAMTDLLAQIRSEGFSEAEVRRLTQAMRLEAAVRRSTVGSLTQELAEGVLFGDVRYGWNAESSLENITPEEIRRVASTYLVGDDATNLIILSKEDKQPDAELLERLAGTVASLGPGKGKAVSPNFAASAFTGDKPPLAVRAEPRPSPAASRSTLPNGLTVILKPAPGEGIVAVSLQVRAGFAFDPAGKEGVAQMVAASLPLGSETVSSSEFRERAATLGSTFGVSLAVETVEAGLTVFPADLKAALELVATAVRTPAFSEADLPGIRDRLVRYRDALSRSPRDTAQVLAREKIFRSHPYAHASMGSDATLATIKRPDLL
ncbi:MAG: insulinase family protein, partial [Acidobacteria bacterium]|nr:insulinase family protein [Acidobacteriota bacterium]